MKKLLSLKISLSIFALCLFSNFTTAQSWTTSSPDKLYVNPINTYVGIGTTFPLTNYRLTVSGGSKRGIYAQGSSYAGYFSGNIGVTGNIKAFENSGIFSIFGNTSDANGPYLKLYGKNNGSRPGGMTLCAYNQGTIEFFTRLSNGWIKHMTINSDSKVAIGTTATPSTVGGANISGYKLFVEGGILTEELRVRTDWADYVFDSDYELTPLSEVAAHIKTNGHLHNTPSAEEIETQGMEVGAIAKNQQEKIEEIFLHLIEMEERIEQLETENSALKAALSEKK